MHHLITPAIVLLTGFVFAAHAQDGREPSKWPQKPITIIVPFPAGSATDSVTRVIANGLGPRLGQPLVIENRPGADSTLGTRAVAKATPDGYTLALGSPSGYIAAPLLNSNAGYDPVKDFAPVSLIGRTPYVLVVSPELGVKNVKELIALAKSKPGVLNYSSVGEGSIAHVGMVVFAKKVGIELTHIPYKSTAQSIIDVASGIINLQLASIPPTVSLYQAGKVQVLAVAGPNRIDLMPDVPTIAEAGVADFEATFWLAMFAPAKTPPSIVSRLNKEVGEVLRAETTKKTLVIQGVDAQASTPEGLDEIVRSDIAAFRLVMDTAGLRRN